MPQPASREEFKDYILKFSVKSKEIELQDNDDI